jgi:RNA polymerase sigma-70 factor (ECF subfamily)
VDDVGAAGAVEAVFREEWGRLLATLVGWFRDLDLAEEVAADAVAAAVERWPAEGVPDHPSAWLLTTARRRAVDVLRRRQAYAAKLAILRVEAERAEVERAAAVPPGEDGIGDDRLRLFFTCCHPALALEARVALTLRYLGGLSTVEVARAFLVPETTMAQRLSRAKRKIREARIPYRVPGPAELPERLPGVLRVVYVVFTEAYAASRGSALTRPDLAEEAIRLARILRRLLPGDREVLGLLALLLLVDARRAARVDPAGGVVLLADQDRSRWDRAKIAEGVALVERALPGGDAGPYALQAAIAALHDEADSVEATDWPQIVALYDLLLRVAASPVVALNRAVAVGMAHGPQAGLALLDELAGDRALERYHLFHSARAGLLERLRRPAEAAQAYRRALAVVGNEPERAFLRRRLAALNTHPFDRPQ